MEELKGLFYVNPESNKELCDMYNRIFELGQRKIIHLVIDPFEKFLLCSWEELYGISDVFHKDLIIWDSYCNIKRMMNGTI